MTGPCRRLATWLAAVGLVWATATAALAGAEETSAGELPDLVRIEVGKARIFRLGTPIDAIFVADPAVADVAVEQDRYVYMVGRSIGETRLLILDTRGTQLSREVVIVPQQRRKVTVHRGTRSQELSCAERCAGAGGASGAAAGAAAAGE